MKRYWLTPPDLLTRLEAQYGPFTFDPCPRPVPDGFNGLEVSWGARNYVNPPFRRKDGLYGAGPTAFVHKAIAEAELGRSSVLVLPCQSYVGLLLRAGAVAFDLGRVRWLEVESKEPCTSPSPIVGFYLAGRTDHAR